MKNTRPGSRCAVRLATAAAALTAALILTMMTVAAATINATDVTIRNSAEDKSDYSNAIGVLQQGDKVTVISKTTDASGNEWFYIELENGNKGYVKAQWVDNGDAAVPEEETAQPEETQEADQEDAVDEEDVIDDDWTPEEGDAAAGTPVSADGSGTGVSPEDSAESQDSPSVDNGQEYDPYTDPNAQFSVNFNTEENGTGSWYIYNYDTDKQIRIGDLEKLSDAQNAAQKSAASAGRWRTIACILLILLVALLVFLYVVLRRNGGAPAPSRRPRRERTRSRASEDEEEDDFDWDSEEADKETSQDSDSEDGDEDTAVPSDDEDDLDEEEEEAPAPRKKKTGLFGAKSRSRQNALFAPMDEDEEEGEEDDEYYDDGLYDDEDDSDEDDDEEDFDEDEERAPRKGGFLNMIKSIFSSGDDEDDYDEDDYDEDEDEDEDDEDYDEDEDYEDEEEEEELPPVKKQSRRSSAESKTAPRPRRPRPARKIEFDEEADYPEDVDLIPAGGWSSPQDNVVTETIEETADAETETAAAAASAATAAKSAARQPAKAAPAVEEDEEEEEEFFADDDDDMEYSFLTSSKRGKRK